VLLMTAHGSEEIAVRALERGAASYVAKASLSRDLMDAVENLLAMARADRRSDRLRECLVLSEHAFVLDNDPALVAPLVDHFQELLSTMRLCDETGRIRAGIALEEALLNALYHGNLELDTEQLRAASVHLLDAGSSDLVRQLRSQAPYRDRRIHVLCRVTSTEATYTIRDDGPGFQPDSVPVPTGPSGLERERGRGLLLMRTFMDEVRYNERGNEVTLIKRREANR